MPTELTDNSSLPAQHETGATWTRGEHRAAGLAAWCSLLSELVTDLPQEFDAPGDAFFVLDAF